MEQNLERFWIEV